MRLDSTLGDVPVSDEEVWVHIANKYHWSKEQALDMDADFIENIIAYLKADGLVRARDRQRPKKS